MIKRLMILVLINLAMASSLFAQGETQKNLHYVHPEFGLKISLPDGSWQFSQKYSLESLGFMSHPKTGAVAYINFNPECQFILSAEHFQKQYRPKMEESMKKGCQDFKKIKDEIKEESHRLAYFCEYTFKVEDKAYHALQRIFFYGEDDFGQRMVALVMVAPEKAFEDKYIRQSFQKIEKSFSFPSSSKAFPYYSSQKYFLSLAIIIGGGLIILIIVTLVILRNKGANN